LVAQRGPPPPVGVERVRHQLGREAPPLHVGVAHRPLPAALVARAVDRVDEANAELHHLRARQPRVRVHELDDELLRAEEGLGSLRKCSERLLDRPLDEPRERGHRFALRMICPLAIRARAHSACFGTSSIPTTPSQPACSAPIISLPAPLYGKIKRRGLPSLRGGGSSIRAKYRQRSIGFSVAGAFFGVPWRVAARRAPTPFATGST